MRMKAIVWGACGSLPSPVPPTSIREKVREAVWAARDVTFSSEAEVESFLDTLAFSKRGTYKANTSCVQIDAGTDDVVLCDAGTGIRDYALSLPKGQGPQTYHIFVSHLHWDHIQGFPFFAPAFQPGNRIIFHGFHKTTEAAIRRQMEGPCFPVPFETMQAAIEFDIRENNAVFHIDGGLEVDAIKQEHPGDSWGYRFRKNGRVIVYSSDSEHGPDSRAEDYRFVDFFKHADVLIFDGQYTFEEAKNQKRHWGHSDHITAVELAARAKVATLAIFHHEPAYSDADIEAISNDATRHSVDFNRELGRSVKERFPKSIQLSFDGLVLEA